MKLPYITPKKGLRALGIAESFRKKGNTKLSILAGVVMRADLQVDGFAFNFCRVGGLDATEAIVSLYKQLNRPDVRVILLSGLIIALYNIIDIDTIYERLGVPVISVTYEDSPGIEKFLKEFPDFEERLRLYNKLGKRVKVRLRNNWIVYLRVAGITLGNAVEILNLYAIHGRYVEPIRVARILARAVFKFLLLGGINEEHRGELCRTICGGY